MLVSGRSWIVGGVVAWIYVDSLSRDYALVDVLERVRLGEKIEDRGDVEETLR